MSNATLTLGACLALMIGSAIWDIASRRIPNFLCALLALAAPTYAYLAGGIDHLVWSLAHGGIALLVSVGLFALGVIGGGDAKLYSAGALAIPLQSGLAYLGWTSLAGLVLLLVMIVGARLFAQEKRSILQMRKAQVPYGVAVASGFGLTLVLAQA